MSDSPEKMVAGCRNENCMIMQGGACANDHEFAADCENAIFSTSKSEPPTEEYSFVTLRKALSLEDVASMLQDREIPTVSVLGPSESGKTTFIAVLFYNFLRSFEGFQSHTFKGSDTFLALNEKLFYAELRSKNTTVKMPRSSLAEKPAFHFKTVFQNEEKESVWIDIAGEALEHLAKDSQYWDQYLGLKRSSHIVLFFDLVVISDRTKRGIHVEQGLDALANSIKSKVWNGRKLLVAFSKSDKFSADMEVHIDKIKKKVEERFSDSFTNIAFTKLSSLGKKEVEKSSVAYIWNWVYED